MVVEVGSGVVVAPACAVDIAYMIKKMRRRWGFQPQTAPVCSADRSQDCRSISRLALSGETWLLLEATYGGDFT